MKKVLLSVVVASSLFSQDMNLASGWQMKGTEVGFSNMQAFNKSCIDAVWSFDTFTNSWKAYSTDSELSQLIKNSSTIQNLTSLSVDEGFWVKTNSSCTVSKDSNLSNTPTVIYQTNALWPYATAFTLDMIASKTFKYDSSGNNTITFDVNGFTDAGSGVGVAVPYGYSTGCSSENTYESNTSLNSDGVLVNKWHNTYVNIDTNATESYSGQNEQKLLAINSDIGYITVTRNYNESNMQYYEYINSMIFSIATENPVNMSTKLPYTIYNSWDLKNKTGIKYNANGTIEHFNKDGIQNYSNDNNFTIENGQFIITYDYNNTNQETHSIDKKQIVFSIGDYDILRTINTGNNKNYQVSYNDVNNTWTSIDLNSSIQTFYDVFTLTNNKIFDNVYDLDNGTFSNTYSCDTSNNFTISSDGKTLTTCWSGDYCTDQTIENGAIVSEYNYDYYETVKTTPFF